ncbi:MAG TPA: mechanosensitive ion channel domain-containing protein [Flavisolibacter sp.]|nr:mechanosensitive ion channel domain-containing protein [Flavisolibacter sp.]
MKRFMDQEFLSNTLRDYFWVAGVILLVIFLNRIISKYIAILLSKIFRKAWKNFDQKSFVQLIIHPLGIFLVISVSIVALYRLSFPDDLNITLYKYTIQRILIAFATIVQVITFTWLMLRIIDFIATVLEARANRTADLSDNQLIVFFRDFLKVVVGIIGGMMILHFAFGYHIGNLLTGLSIVGAAIALALRESLENLIASFVIFFDKPFTTGDFVKVQSVAGNVERIGLRSTRVRTTDKSYVTVPNKQMVDSILDNVTLRSQIRGEINLFINLQTPPAKIQQLLEEVKKYLGTVAEIQGGNAIFSDIRKEAYIVFIEFFTPAIDWNRFTLIRQNLNFFILQTMERLDIKITAEGTDIAIAT